MARVAVGLVALMRSIAPATVRIGWSWSSSKRCAGVIEPAFDRVGTVSMGVQFPTPHWNAKRSRGP